MAESKGRMFARLMDEELAKLKKGPDDPITRGELLDALRAVHDRALAEVQESIYALAKWLLEALDEPPGAMSDDADKLNGNGGVHPRRPPPWGSQGTQKPSSRTAWAFHWVGLLRRGSLLKGGVGQRNPALSQFDTMAAKLRNTLGAECVATPKRS